MSTSHFYQHKAEEVSFLPSEWKLVPTLLRCHELLSTQGHESEQIKSFRGNDADSSVLEKERADFEASRKLFYGGPEVQITRPTGNTVSQCLVQPARSRVTETNTCSRRR